MEKIEELLSGQRQRAYKKYQMLPIPSKKDEGWRFTDISTLKLDEFSLANQEIKFIFPEEARKKGVIFTDIKTAFEKHHKLILEHLPNSLITEEDKFSAMHAAYWTEGVFIYVPKNLCLSVPLENSFIVQKGAFNHTIIIVDENATLSYIEEHKSDNGDMAFRNDCIEVYLKENASLNFYNLQRWNNKVISVSNWAGRLDSDSRINWFFGQFGGKLSRVKISTMLSGKGSSAKASGIYYGYRGQHFDFTTNVYHLVPNTSCNILVKGVLDGETSSVYRGKIKINKEAQITDSYQADHVLLLGDAVSNSIPSLEIDANDVKASHGVTMGKPDEDEIFYLMARGLDNSTAEKLIINGFFSDAIDRISSEDIKIRFEEVLNKG